MIAYISEAEEEHLAIMGRITSSTGNFCERDPHHTGTLFGGVFIGGAGPRDPDPDLLTKPGRRAPNGFRELPLNPGKRIRSMKKRRRS